MSSETITTALLLITAVVAAGVLISAVYPVVYTMAGSFSSTTHASDVRMRTDFKVISTVASGSTARVWMKNVGSEAVPYAEIQRSDVFCGAAGDFERLSYSAAGPASLSSGEWSEDFLDPAYDLNGNRMWDTGETVKITAETDLIPAFGQQVYFQFSLPSGVWRTGEFTVS
jgi:flagellar protein FlaG